MKLSRHKLLAALLALCLFGSAGYNLHAYRALQTQAQKSQVIFLSNFTSVSNVANVSLRNLQLNRDIYVTEYLHPLISSLSTMEATLYYGADAVGPELLTGCQGIGFGSIASLLRGTGETRGNISLQAEPFDADGLISDKELLFLHRLDQDLTALRAIADEDATSDTAYARFVDALDEFWRTWSLDNPESPCLAFATPAGAD